MMANEFEVRLTKGVDLPVPDAIANWLGRAMLLYGVPFNYLVPDERMLPPESIRFFYLDPAWVNSLLAGACSMGRGTARDEMVDQELSKHFLARAAAAGAQLRDSAVSRTNASDEAPPPALNWPISGFLLRSSVVEAFVGLDVIAATGFNAETEQPIGKLQALRIDRLGPDVLLCIYNGVLNFIEVKQPLEGLHFGASPTPEAGGFEKLSVRRVNAPAGTQIPDPKDSSSSGQRPPPPLNVPMRPGAKRVVSVKQLAGDLERRLKDMGAMDREGPPSVFTAAEFGLQMVESPGRVRIKAVDKGMEKSGNG